LNIDTCTMRKPRIKSDASEAFYHVMTRTSQCVFNLAREKDPEIKSICHDVIQKMAAIYHVEIYAWALMDNHIHLCLSVLRPPKEEANISRRFEALQKANVRQREWYPWLWEKYYDRFCDLSWFMWEIKTRIARAFNQRNQTSGFFWGGRFKSKLIEDESALLRVMTYIEQNPVRAGLCERPSQFPWCSAGYTHIQLKKKIAVTVPTIGPFRKWAGSERARSYVLWMDYQADLILNPEKRFQNLPKTVAAVCLKGQTLYDWREEFKSGEPSNWRTQAYGCKSFEKTVRHLEDEKILSLANQRAMVSRARKEQNCHGSHSFNYF